MQINFLTHPAEHVAKVTEITGETENVRHDTKNIPDEAKPEFKAKLEDSSKIQQLQHFLSEHNINLKFSVHDETNQLVIELVDSKTGDAIRQLPSEVSLKFSAAFTKVQGQLIDETI